MHDNDGAIALYERMGFERVPAVGIKRKNPINETLFAPVRTRRVSPNSTPTPGSSPTRRHARHQGRGARRQGRRAAADHGGTSVVTRESLSELTNAVAMSRCDDKRVTRRVVADAGIRVPPGRTATFSDQDYASSPRSARSW